MWSCGMHFSTFYLTCPLCSLSISCVYVYVCISVSLSFISPSLWKSLWVYFSLWYFLLTFLLIFYISWTCSLSRWFFFQLSLLIQLRERLGELLIHCFISDKQCSVQFRRSVESDSSWSLESQHARSPCPSPSPAVHSDSRSSSPWCNPAISSLVIPFSSCPECLPASESFPMSQLFTWGGQSTGVSALASFLPKKYQGWSPSEWTGWISLLIPVLNYDGD